MGKAYCFKCNTSFNFSKNDIKKSYVEIGGEKIKEFPSIYCPNCGNHFVLPQCECNDSEDTGTQEFPFFTNKSNTATGSFIREISLMQQKITFLEDLLWRLYMQTQGKDSCESVLLIDNVSETVHVAAKGLHTFIKEHTEQQGK